ncbi:MULTISPECIES: phytanoyl-CoA dioxygenase family protein [Moorena]|uniref:Phytanoyl-CoA dioxygenase, PhyH n=1 Tax=Moorena producens 3L TaxID=489825 RepID=F4XT58_9CYAN|nr:MULTISPECIES: phytanoyl-CoA dioxygenase family protein [Moorena]EGJ32233.1 phytanoyl-CoA dioxygenase, PhyH [Moorena producens 3L]NEP34163.1 hypothetical protein [Moorena sp. SIO3B2]NEP64459.1 hypothetical protein [Moorena sp. SIO3A5]NEQ07848.1 hypothetical protein [Moorena sp. SIO4E2]NER87625.1 hypothetical protein [Moorena sp. SIO3A2]
MYELTDDQVNTFYHKGWIGPLDIFSYQEVESVRKEIEAISQIELLDEQKILTFSHSDFGVKTAHNHHLYCKLLSDIFEDKRVVSRLNQLGEANLLLWRTSIFHRMPGQEGIDWHQAIQYYEDYPNINENDLFLLFPKGEKVLNITVWIALEDLTSEMGTLFFANGSHRQQFQSIEVSLGEGLLKEEKCDINLEAEPESKRYSKVCQFNENEWEIESIPMVKAGQAIIFTEQVMHSAPSNCSNKERWVIVGRYIRPSVIVHPQLQNNNYIDSYGCDLRKHFCILVSGSDNYKINKVVTRN